MVSSVKDRFLITGSTGFIGACLTRELVRQKKHVSVIVRDKKLNWRLRDITSSLHIYECDIASNYLTDIVNEINPTYVFHLAAYGALPTEKDFDQMMLTNIKGIKNLIDASQTSNYKLFINTGSSSEYGIKNKSMNETDMLEPVNDYSITKVAASLYSQKHAKVTKKPIITFRLSSPYGYYEEKSRLIPWVILHALQNKPIQLSLAQNVRDFIFVEDVVNAYIKATEVKINPGEVYNIGSGKQHTIKEVVDVILKLTESNSKIEWGAMQQQERQIEPKKWVADIQKAKDLEWRPIHSLEQGLSKTITWFKKNYSLYV